MEEGKTIDFNNDLVEMFRKLGKIPEFRDAYNYVTSKYPAVGIPLNSFKGIYGNFKKQHQEKIETDYKQYVGKWLHVIEGTSSYFDDDFIIHVVNIDPTQNNEAFIVDFYLDLKSLSICAGKSHKISTELISEQQKLNDYARVAMTGSSFRIPGMAPIVNHCIIKEVEPIDIDTIESIREDMMKSYKKHADKILGLVKDKDEIEKPKQTLKEQM